LKISVELTGMSEYEEYDDEYYEEDYDNGFLSEEEILEI